MELRKALRPLFFSKRTDLLMERLEKKLLKTSYLIKYWRWYHLDAKKKLRPFGAGSYDLRLRYEFYRVLADAEGLSSQPLDYLEFGVAAGDSMRWWCAANRDPKSRFTGFDTFAGLPEAWESLPIGAFSTGGKTPEIDDARCSFQVGLVQHTLPGFLKSAALPNRKVVHMDLDIFSATLFSLLHIASILRKGDILIFDEFSNYLDEFRAFHHFLDASLLKAELLFGTNEFAQAAYKLE